MSCKPIETVSIDADGSSAGADRFPAQLSWRRWGRRRDLCCDGKVYTAGPFLAIPAAGTYLLNVLKTLSPAGANILVEASCLSLSTIAGYVAKPSLCQLNLSRMFR